jgi:Flp pilus assembly protein TadD
MYKDYRNIAWTKENTRMSYQIVPATLYEAQNAYRRLQYQMNMDDPSTTIVEIKTFLKMYPDVALPYNDLGVLYSRVGEKLLSLACYEKANRIQPGNPSIIKNLAEFYFVELGWVDDAIMMLTQLLNSFPDDSDLLRLMVDISRRVGREQEAQLFSQRLSELEQKDSAITDVHVCDVSPAASPVSGRPEVAHEETATESAPVTDSLEDILARIRQTLSQETTDVVRQPSLAADELYRRAQEQLSAGDDDQALLTLEQLVTQEPDNALAHNDLGVLHTRRGDLKQALLHHETAVRNNPANTTFQKNLAALYYSCLGRTDEAITIYTRLLREYPDDVEVLTALAIISAANRLGEQARLFIGRVVELEPWNTEARNFLAGL